MPVEVYEATRFESLWRRFEHTVREPLSSVLAPEIIVVPAQGWSVWFQRELIRTRRCLALLRFQPFGQWMAELLAGILGPELAPYRERDTLVWEVAACLPGLIPDESFGAVRAWLFAESSTLDPLRLIDLSRCIAELFDRYLLQRPELIAAWEQGQDWFNPLEVAPADAVWQRKLWQKITQRRPFRSVQAMTDDLARLLDEGTGSLPERVSIWHAGALSPVHLRFLETIGRHTVVRLFLLVPASTYWGDMRGRRQLLRQLRDSSLTLRQFCDLHHLDVLHPLLSSMGSLSRRQQMLLVDCDGEPWQFQEVVEDESAADLVGNRPLESSGSPHQEEPSPASLLRELQSDLHAAFEPERRPLPDDGSIRVHSCHSALREIEVLHTELRAAFESDLTLMPEDVVVLTPDLEAIAPLVQAVFGRSRPNEPGHIPFHLAGRSPRHVQPLVDAWSRLVELLPGRLPASEVLDLLALEPVRSAAGISADEIDTAIEWVRDAGICWGMETAHRVQEGLPKTDLNTWQFGLDRLLLGYLMPPGGGQMTGSVLALDRASGLRSALLGRIWEFIARLQSWRTQIETPRSLIDWQLPLSRMLPQMLDVTLDETSARQIHEAIDRLAKFARDAGFDAPAPFDLVVREVGNLMDESGQNRPFRTGGVLFCAMDAVRSLPAKVVALVGMNDGSFPGSDRPLRFDLMARQPRPEDFSRRDLDRHLFLESILSARRQLIITFTGQDIRDQRHRPPSVVIDELLDALERTHRPDPHATDDALRDPDSFRRHLLVQHPLHAFSPACFDDSDNRLRSFDPQALVAARRLQSVPDEITPFITAPLPAEELTEVTVEELIRLVEKPWRLLVDRLGLSLTEDAAGESDREPLLLNSLEEWKIGEAWLAERLSDRSVQQLQTDLHRSGALPGGSLGQAVLTSLSGQARAILDEAVAANANQPPQRLTVDCELGGVRLLGTLRNWTESGLRRVTFSRVEPRHAPRLWVEQLVAAAARGLECPVAKAIGRNNTKLAIASIEPAPAKAQLQKLIQLWRLARRFPLAFYPAKVMFQLLEKDPALSQPESISKIQQEVWKELSSDRSGPGLDPAWNMLFEKHDPVTMTLPEEFASQDAGDLPGTSREPVLIRMARAVAVPVQAALQRTND